MIYFREILEHCTSNGFIKDISKKYHYSEQDAPLLLSVVGRMRQCMLREAGWEQRMFLDEEQRAYAEVVMTLGPGVDALQEEYVRQGLLSECYMVEALGSEILLLGYEAYNRWVEAHTAYHVARYYFLGSEERYPLANLPHMLERLAEVSVSCNDAYCMLPKKSVAFYAALTEDPQVSCRGICVGCDSLNCPNRIVKVQTKGWNFADMTDRPLPYGYSRIFGKERLS